MSTWYPPGGGGGGGEGDQKLVKLFWQKLEITCQKLDVDGSDIKECIDVVEEKDVVSIENQLREECWDKRGNVTDGENEEEWAQEWAQKGRGWDMWLSTFNESIKSTVQLSNFIEFLSCLSNTMSTQMTEVH